MASGPPYDAPRSAISRVSRGHLARLSGPFLDSFKKRGQDRRVPAPALQQRLRDAGLRVTRPRLAVLEALRALAHADTESVIHAVRRDRPEVSHQAVYDSLRILTKHGLARRVQPGGSVARYELRVGDNHHHLVCRSCGAIVDVDCAVGEVPCLTASDRHGYVVDEAEVIYWGLCPACTARPTGSATTQDDPSRQEKQRRV
jgi:Fe2+ or Zn2+ uptake regulation protein